MIMIYVFLFVLLIKLSFCFSQPNPPCFAELSSTIPLNQCVPLGLQFSFTARFVNRVTNTDSEVNGLTTTLESFTNPFRLISVGSTIERTKIIEGSSVTWNNLAIACPIESTPLIPFQQIFLFVSTPCGPRGTPFTFEICPTTVCESGGRADPSFVGFLGNSFQFHGRPDSIFSLVSSPSLNFVMNAYFIYLYSGTNRCNEDYLRMTKSDALNSCFSHPGTYMRDIGIQVNGTRILFSANSYMQGFSININGKSYSPDKNIYDKEIYIPLPLNSNTVLILGISNKVFVEAKISTKDFFIRIRNSDSFLNFDFSVKNIYIKETMIQGKVGELDMTGVLGYSWNPLAKNNKRGFYGETDDYLVEEIFDYLLWDSSLI